LAYFQHANEYVNEAETSLKLFQAVSVFHFSFISESATGLRFIPNLVQRKSVHS